jgi:hypothetical protein
MAVSRPVVIALVGAVLVAVAFLATSGSRSSDGPAAVQAPPSAKAESSAKPAPKAHAEGEQVATLARDQRAAAAQRGVPARVTRAIDAGRTAVLFFFQPGAADDGATAGAVRALRGERKVSVFVVPISRVADYRAVVSGAGVSQAPAVVIANKRGATLVEGYVDRASLAQRVADAR